MPLGAADIAAIAAQLSATVEDLVKYMPDGSTVADQVAAVGPRLYAEMQLSLRRSYGELADPLPDDLRETLGLGILAEVLYLGIIRLPEDAKAWPDLWRQRFEQRVLELAANVADSAQSKTIRLAGSAAGQTQQFTLSRDRAAALGTQSLLQVLGNEGSGGLY